MTDTSGYGYPSAAPRPKTRAELDRLIEAGNRVSRGSQTSKSEPDAAGWQTIRDGIDARIELREMDDLTELGDRTLKALGRRDYATADGRGYLDFTGVGRRRLADQITAKMGDGYGRKALTVAGTAVNDIPLLPASPIAMGTVPQNLLSVLPVTTVPSGSVAQFLQQQTRTNLAAPVEPGAVKPTSLYGLVRQTVSLEVVAHLSEPINRFDLEDASNLSVFVQQEMVAGLAVALEAEVIGGSGTPPALRGFSHTSGIQIVAATTGDLLTTLRSAITALETQGHGESIVIALDPVTWQKAETARNESGAFDLQGPVDRAKQQVWGTPVVLSTQLPAGKALVLSTPATTLYADSQGVRSDWSSPGDLCPRNELACRTEGRFALAVLQPLGVALVSLPTDPPPPEGE